MKGGLHMARFELSSPRDMVSDSGAFEFKQILKGVALAFVISIVLILISAVIMTYSPIPDEMTRAVTIAVSGISVLFAGLVTARKSRRQGWLSGATCGLLYALFLYIFGSLIMLDFSITLYTLIVGVMGFFLGALGGIVGINTKKRKRR